MADDEVVIDGRRGVDVVDGRGGGVAVISRDLVTVVSAQELSSCEIFSVNSRRSNIGF